LLTQLRSNPLGPASLTFLLAFVSLAKAFNKIIMESKKVKVLTNTGDQVEIEGSIAEKTVFIERSEISVASLREDFPSRIANAFGVEIIRIVSSIDGFKDESSKFELRPYESN
jgi:hypothetical protein